MKTMQSNRIESFLPKSKEKAKPKNRKMLYARQKQSINRIMAALAAGFIPIASYVVAHVEAQANPWLYTLVAGALLYSAPTLVTWAEKWCGNRWKAIGFTILLEGVMVASHIPSLSLSALAILVGINAAYAHSKAK